MVPMPCKSIAEPDQPAYSIKMLRMFVFRLNEYWRTRPACVFDQNVTYVRFPLKWSNGYFKYKSQNRDDPDQTARMRSLIWAFPAHIPEDIFSLGTVYTGGGSFGCASNWRPGGCGFHPAGSATFFRGDWSWNIFYGHSLPSADSRRAVLSFLRNTG